MSPSRGVEALWPIRARRTTLYSTSPLKSARPSPPSPPHLYPISLTISLIMPDDSALAKMLADALANVQDLSRRLAAAEDRAVRYERLAHQQEARLLNAADIWQTLERSLLHTRAELGRVLPTPPATIESSSTPASTVSATTTPTTRTLPLGRVSTQVQLPSAKSLGFPTLPPPPVANPRNSQLLAPINSTTTTPVAATAASLQPAPASVRSGAATLSDRKERARFSDSPPPAAPLPADSRKRKRDHDIDEELVAAADGDGESTSEMSLDDMILAASGDGLLQPQVPVAAAAGAQPGTSTSPALQPPRKKHAASASVSSLPSTASTPSASGTTAATASQAPTQQALFPSHNAQGQRQCRACGQAGRYKDGKCVEKWGPGPAGPGTVCDRYVY
ncbi:hypothetical protein BKA62DRAFT_314330 [Auriculariales sp. MPI-PUGE-AT-0066]|nr:hypothetical protein BKA62DRAFT_314330 [Auriculariales sp. MPI-PUGE-AT-0066]